MNIFLILILTLLLLNYLTDLIIEILNLRSSKTDLPKEFEEYYDKEKYRKSQLYLKDNTIINLIADGFFLILVIVFILLHGFNLIDKFVRNFRLPFIFTGLTYTFLIVFLTEVVRLPFSYYHTFVIEKKYGFNRTTFLIFVSDTIKKWFLGLIIGSILLSIIFWLFNKFGPTAWIYCWIFVVLFEIFLTFIAPVVILPLFNKFTAIDQTELKTAIESYAKTVNFKFKGIFKMDASKRSTKSNAFFIGFGKFKRIVIYDTLIAKHTLEEIISIIAHEIGHYKLKHIQKFLLISTANTGIIFFIFSKLLNNPILFSAFSMEHTSVYASLFFFGLLFTPINRLLSVITNIFSRKFEYQADKFAISTYGKPEVFTTALKKLSSENLTNLNPHPLKVFLEYSHPPIIERIKKIQSYLANNFNNYTD